MPVTITRPCAARIRSIAAAKARAEAVAQRGGKRVDAAAFRVERAQGGIDRRLRAVAGHVGWFGLGHAEVSVPCHSRD